MIKVTAQQRANALEALNVMWPSVPPENVVPRLADWATDCGTVACFGGWCSRWPAFQAQGVCIRFMGWPVLRGGGRAGTSYDNPVAEHLFGDRSIFRVRRDEESGTDHEVVTKRLRALIRNSVVAE